jgi:hypothetical protein
MPVPPGFYFLLRVWVFLSEGSPKTAQNQLPRAVSKSFWGKNHKNTTVSQTKSRFGAFFRREEFENTIKTGNNI